MVVLPMRWSGPMLCRGSKGVTGSRSLKATDIHLRWIMDAPT
jgi:hypothetical protein